MLKEMLEISDDEKIQKTINNIFAYLFSNIKKSDLKKCFSKEENKLIDSRFLQNGYILKNCKLYIHNKLKGRKCDLLGVCSEDIPILNKVSINLVKPHCKPLTIKGMDKLLSALHSKYFQDYINKYVNKKLIFLTRSYGVSKSELVSELQFAGIYAIYKKYPYFVSELHALNIAKSAIHNRGINLITFYTRKKRQALICNPNGFAAVCCNVDNLPISSSDEEIRDKRDTIITLSNIQKKIDRKGQIFINLFLGNYDKKFSSYLNMNNSDYYHNHTENQYLSRLCKYLNIDKEHVNDYLLSFQKYL